MPLEPSLLQAPGQMGFLQGSELKHVTFALPWRDEGSQVLRVRRYAVPFFYQMDSFSHSWQLTLDAQLWNARRLVFDARHSMPDTRHSSPAVLESIELSARGYD
jgi:hypothetical protein